MKRYVSCDCCKANIYENGLIYKCNGGCGLFCSEKCYLKAMLKIAEVVKLNKYVIEFTASSWKMLTDEEERKLKELEEAKDGCFYCTGSASSLENHHAIKTQTGWIVETDMKFCWNCGKELEV